MSTIINKVGSIIGGTVQVQFQLIAKDVTDAALVSKFGDVIIVCSGTFNDPNDNTFPAFYVNAGDPVHLFTTGLITLQLADPTMTMALLQRQASLWAASILTQITTKITALRDLSDTITGTTVETI